MLTFNRPYTTGEEFGYIQEAIDNRHLSGHGPFDARCAAWLEEWSGCSRALLTFSCTSALELAAILAEIGPGDEVIMPSFTFVTSASSVALRGGVPVFVEIRPDTLTLDPAAVEAALTDRTKAIMPVHYAGVPAAMDELLEIARSNQLLVIEDAATAILSTYRGRPAGGMGDLGCLSFHETKNVTCGEGGALLVNRGEWVDRAEILQQKGTNRNQFMRGQVDKYTWVDLGSSFLTSEINAAYLWAQLENAARITAARLEVWHSYHERFEELEGEGLLARPHVPGEVEHNAHMYYLLLPTREARDLTIEHLQERGIQAVFHYVPLHSSPAGERFGRAAGDLSLTDDVSGRLVRLPLWVGMGEAEVDLVATAVGEAVR